MRDIDRLIEAFTNAIRICMECDRRFDLRDTDDCEEWYGGHDCEEVDDVRR